MNKKKLIEALRDLLLEGEAKSQESLCQALQDLGYDVNQSKISRLLKKIGASKVANGYSLPLDPAPPAPDYPISHLIISVAHNESIIVIHTSPGAASLVARMLDFAKIKTEVLGTVAGDDTLFVTPKTTKNTKKLAEEIKKSLQK